MDLSMNMRPFEHDLEEEEKENLEHRGGRVDETIRRAQSASTGDGPFGFSHTTTSPCRRNSPFETISPNFVGLEVSQTIHSKRSQPNPQPTRSPASTMPSQATTSPSDPANAPTKTKLGSLSHDGRGREGRCHRFIPR